MQKTIVLIVAIALGCALVWLGSMAFVVLVHVRQEIAVDRRMRTPAYYEEAARQLALYCQSVDKKISDHGVLRGNLFPEIIREFKPFWGHISPEGAWVQISRDLNYSLTLNKAASNETQSVWDLYIWGEESRERLCTVTLNREDRIPIKTMVGSAIEAYDKEIKKKPRSIYLHKAKITYLLLFEQTKLANKACRQAIEMIPKHWWPRLTMAFLESSLGDADEASIEFAKWVEIYPSYPHYFYLAYFCFKENRVSEFCEAVEKALKCPLNTDGDHTFNVYYFGLEMAGMACESEKNELAIAVCDAMEDPRRERERATSSEHYIDFNAFKRAIQSDRRATWGENWIRNRDRFNPYQSPCTNAIQPITVGRHRFPSAEVEAAE